MTPQELVILMNEVCNELSIAYQQGNVSRYQRLEHIFNIISQELSTYGTKRLGQAPINKKLNGIKRLPEAGRRSH